jgi:photosystem II stability/assembly factor-like uncharacterized protein
MNIYKNKLIILAFIVFTAIQVFANSSSDTLKFGDWKVVGPNGGDIRAVAVDPKDKNRLYATTVDSQVYRSLDAGKSWKHLVTFNRPQITLDNLMIDSQDSNKIYVSGHRHKEPGGFFRSDDGGETWKESKDLRNQAIHALTQSDKDPKMFVAGGFGKVFISLDSGENWNQVQDEKPFNEIIVDSVAVDPRDSNIIFAGTSYRAYKTIDGGKTWALKKDGMIDDSDVFVIDINKQNPDHIIASACSGIYESYNNGELWKKIQGIPSQSRRTRAILQNPSGNGGIYAGTTEGFWMSADAGKTWALTTQRELEVNSISVNADEPNKIYIATNNYGLMISNDGGRNFAINNGNLTSRFILDITPDIQKPNRFYATTKNTATGGGFFFISDDNGQTWKPSMQNLSIIRTVPFSFLQDAITPNTLYLGTNIGMYRSLDRGISWTQLPVPKIIPAKKSVTKKVIAKKGVKPAAKSPLKPVIATSSIKRVGGFAETVNKLVYSNDGKNSMFAATNKGLFRTNNVATGWDKFSFGSGIDERIFSVASSSKMPTRIFAGTTLSGLVVSNDNGLTWLKISGVPTTAPVVAIQIDPENADLIYVGTTQALYLSRDGGTNWSRRSNLPPGSFSAILINPSNTNEVFVGSSLEGSGGIYQSVDAGKNWKRIDDKDLSLPTRRVWALSFDPKNNNRILIGTHSSGIYIIERPVAAATNEGETRPRISGNE